MHAVSLFRLHGLNDFFGSYFGYSFSFLGTRLRKGTTSPPLVALSLFHSPHSFGSVLARLRRTLLVFR
jgi:hypothetical protein